MRLWRDLVFRLRALTGRSLREDELDEELRFHLEMEIERRMAAGESQAEASRAARLDFGAVESVKEQVRDAWGVRLVDETRRDLQGALRQLVASPAFSAVAAGSLAVALGTATVIFSLVDAVLLRPLTFANPAALVSLEEITPEGMPFSVSEANLLDFERLSHGLEEVAAWIMSPPRPALEMSGRRLRLLSDTVTPSFFSVLGVEAQIGRTFDPRLMRGGEAPREVVLSDSCWRRLFGAAPDVVGQTIDLDGELWTVIGVLPEDFRLGTAVQDVFLPFVPRESYQRGNHYLKAFARLAEGTSLEQAREELHAIADTLARRHPESNEGWGIQLQPFDHFLLGAENRRAQGILLGASALLLLLACANVSNLLLARSADRRDEIQLRLCLGASRGRLHRQILVESLLLATLGGACALGLAALAVPWVRGLDVALPRLDQVSLGGRSLVFLVVTTVASSLLFGLVSALRATAVGKSGSLRARRQGSDKGSRRLRSALVMSEVALAMVLAVGAGLLLRSFEQLKKFDSGFDVSGILLARFDLPPERYPDGERAPRLFFDRLIEKLEALPGVEAVGGSSVSPFLDSGTMNVVALETEVELNAFSPVHWRAVTSDYFEALGIPMLRGRSFTPQTNRLETVISASLARRLWPEGEAIGERLRWRLPDGPLLEVVGVVGDVQDLTLGDERTAMVYWPQSTMGRQSLTLALRTNQELTALASPVRDAVRELDPLLAAPELSTLSGQRVGALARPLLSLRLVAFSASIALLLAAAGVFGMVAYAVSRRQREMGVRAAIGARPGQLISLVIRDAATLLAGGLAGGLAVSLGVVEALRLLLYQTSPFDPQVLAMVVAILVAVGLLASSLPALRAGRVDPIIVLRQD